MSGEAYPALHTHLLLVHETPLLLQSATLLPATSGKSYEQFSILASDILYNTLAQKVFHYFVHMNKCIHVYI